MLEAHARIAFGTTLTFESQPRHPRSAEASPPEARSLKPSTSEALIAKAPAFESSVCKSSACKSMPLESSLLAASSSLPGISLPGTSLLETSLPGLRPRPSRVSSMNRMDRMPAMDRFPPSCFGSGAAWLISPVLTPLLLSHPSLLRLRNVTTECTGHRLARHSS
jgi:hypothetical protein